VNRYVVTIPVTAQTSYEAKRVIVDALGFDEYSINDIGGVVVTPVPDEKQFLVCRGCGQAYDSLTAAHEHGASNFPGPNPLWCGENGFDIVSEEDAL